MRRRNFAYPSFGRYTYPFVLYAESSDAAIAFADATSGGAFLSWRQDNYSFEICRQWKGKLGGWDDRGRALGGWTFSAQHAYDLRSQTLYRGDGERTSGTDRNRLVANTPIGTGASGSPTEGAKATTIAVGNIAGALAVGPDRSVYFQSDFEVWKMRPDGTVTRLATQTDIGPGRVALAVGNDGLLYMVASGGGGPPVRLRRRETNGTFTTLATLPYSCGACHETAERAEDVCRQMRSKKAAQLCWQQLNERLGQCISFCNQAYLGNGGL